MYNHRRKLRALSPMREERPLGLIISSSTRLLRDAVLVPLYQLFFASTLVIVIYVEHLNISVVPEDLYCA